MRVLVVANGAPPSRELAQRLAAPAALVIAADGGAGLALSLGLRPDFVVGDLDSLSEAARASLPAEAVVSLPDPHRTDLEKAVAFAVARGATAVDVIGAGEGRADHAFANLSVLFSHPDAEVRVVDDDFAIRAVRGHATVDLPAGTVVSLVAVGVCEGVTTDGLRWPLVEATLPFSPRGVHNEIVKRPAGVRVRSGDLLLFEGGWIERHQ